MYLQASSPRADPIPCSSRKKLTPASSPVTFFPSRMVNEPIPNVSPASETASPRLWTPTTVERRRMDGQGGDLAGQGSWGFLFRLQKHWLEVNENFPELIDRLLTRDGVAGRTWFLWLWAAWGLEERWLLSREWFERDGEGSSSWVGCGVGKCLVRNVLIEHIWLRYFERTEHPSQLHYDSIYGFTTLHGTNLSSLSIRSDTMFTCWIVSQFQFIELSAEEMNKIYVQWSQFTLLFVSSMDEFYNLTEVRGLAEFPSSPSLYFLPGCCLPISAAPIQSKNCRNRVIRVRNSGEIIPGANCGLRRRSFVYCLLWMHKAD